MILVCLGVCRPRRGVSMVEVGTGRRFGVEAYRSHCACREVEVGEKRCLRRVSAVWAL